MILCIFIYEHIYYFFQVIISKTISKPDKMRSIVQKIALQLNAKLGGELWAVEIPVSSLMVVGIDVYHDKSKGASVSGFVSSLNKNCTRWFSTTTQHMPGQEIAHGLKVAFIEALEAFNRVRLLKSNFGIVIPNIPNYIFLIKLLINCSLLLKECNYVLVLGKSFSA